MSAWEALTALVHYILIPCTRVRMGLAVGEAAVEEVRAWPERKCTCVCKTHSQLPKLFLSFTRYQQPCHSLVKECPTQNNGSGSGYLPVREKPYFLGQHLMGRTDPPAHDHLLPQSPSLQPREVRYSHGLRRAGRWEMLLRTGESQVFPTGRRYREGAKC